MQITTYVFHSKGDEEKKNVVTINLCTVTNKMRQKIKKNPSSCPFSPKCNHMHWLSKKIRSKIENCYRCCTTRFIGLYYLNSNSACLVNARWCCWCRWCWPNAKRYIGWLSQDRYTHAHRYYTYTYFMWKYNLYVSRTYIRLVYIKPMYTNVFVGICIFFYVWVVNVILYVV